MFDAIYGVTQLRIQIRSFYEVSRILTKHCGNYEAQKLGEMAALLEKTIKKDMDKMERYERIIQFQVVALRHVMNFLIGTLEEEQDVMEEEEIEKRLEKNEYECTIPKSMALLGHIIGLLQKYQMVHFENNVQNGELEKGVESLAILVRSGRERVLYLEGDVISLIHMQNGVLKKIVSFLKTAVKMECKKRDVFE